MEKRFLAPGLALVMLPGCNGEPPESETVISVDLDRPAADAPAPSPPPPPPPPEFATNVANDGYPDLEPAPLDPEVDKTAKGARNVLLAFTRALEQRQWDRAWAMLDENSQTRWPKAAWADMFADLKTATVGASDGTMEGAAGSSFYTAPLALTGTDQAGRPVRYEGEVVLRRVNDVPGATPAQLRWHIESMTLDLTH